MIEKFIHATNDFIIRVKSADKQLQNNIKTLIDHREGIKIVQSQQGSVQSANCLVDPHYIANIDEQINQQVSLSQQCRSVFEKDISKLLEILQEGGTREMQILPIMTPQLIQLRLSEDYSPTGKKEQNYEWPAVVRYDNPIIGIQCDSQNSGRFNFVTLNGDRSKLYCDVPLQEVRIKPKGAIVRKVVIWWIKNNQNLYAIQFLDKDDQCVLKAGFFHSSY